MAKGLSPCLPVLDDFIPAERSAQGIDLGVMQIPSEFIVGTKTRGRVNAFAPNFMPMLDEGTEFATKWQRLCEAHLSEGIREPIKAYEYMNRFYVEEGHKRVSVLKYFNAPSIDAHVIRILPVRNGDPETELYYEFVDFYKYSKVNFVEFSQPGSYTELQRMMGKQPGALWTEDERRHFASGYYYFRQAYQASGGEKFQSTVGDALLSYINIYGYPRLSNSGAGEIKKDLHKMWEEVALRQEDPPIELKLTPDEGKKPGIFSAVLATGSAAVLKAAFLYDGTPERSGWVLGHELGRQYVQRVFDGRIQTVAYADVMDSDPLAVIEQAIAAGHKLIFTTSPRLTQASLRAAVEHPETLIMNCSLNSSHRYIRSYYARMYEAKFIIGAIAGSLTESGRLGYVCDYPIFGQIAGINAFALGAQMTNPRARVYLEWSSVKGDDGAVEALKERDIHLISSQDTAQLSRGSRSSFGLSCIHGDDRELLAYPVWNWGVYYEEILHRILNKTVKAEYNSSRKALNYYWGMSAGVVDIVYADTLSFGTRRLAEFLKQGICREACDPFATPLLTQSGARIGEGQRALSQEQIISMDYLVENVIGRIPRYEELSPKGQATADSAGVRQATHLTADDPEKGRV
ncbi:MAG: BMP family ABC transporter substrate-binding protein [Firmicutes bacterium]|nr:BMP family ABC transporter substrate-binding protein [Bacillota bacterium]